MRHERPHDGCRERKGPDRRHRRVEHQGRRGSWSTSYAVVLVGGGLLVNDHTTFQSSPGRVGADGAPSGSDGSKFVVP